ncbi:hypothetical protein DMN91_002335 [Ooceraea biroi]|uniref:DDE-1 domain-containing protein n=1 Tax=Ooceraea biroi TaxID=2015173 RepID=A0A3L8E1V3_OOCBI|nr:hypothetical protein DMN91_002335 [Ooceraea biroi]
MARMDWYYNFMKRHPNISLRRPEATSLNRVTAFNKEETEKFFSNLRELMLKYNFGPSSIYNVDETGISNVQRNSKILAPKGQKQVGKCISAERGSTTTVINAIPDESLKHFLLIGYNHESHISLEAYNYCRKNDIHLLTLPPHTSHRMQPLDLTFYSPLKNAYNKECESYMMNHPGQAITAFEIVGLFTKAFNRTANIEKAANGFKAAGIYPFNSGKFDELYIEPNQPTIEEPPRDLNQAETFTPRNTSVQSNIAAPDNCNIGSTST